MSDLFGVIRSPASIVFGSGQRRILPKAAARFGTRFFICSDERIGTDPHLQEIIASLVDAGLRVAIYDRTAPELPRSCVSEATEAARAFGPDAVIGLGGGSCLDLAKLVSLSLTHEGDLSEFYGELKVPGPTLPVIAVPTTAGTGSEVTPIAVIADPQRALKVGISSPYLIPIAAICDPELTLSCPRGLTAIAGADALTHAIEAFTAITQPDRSDLAVRQVFVGKNAVSDVFCRAAIQKLATSLPEAVENGRNLAAREEVMMGALLAGLGFGVAGTAAAHALQYPVGAATGTAHGLGVACLMPYVMRFNRREIDGELREIATLCGAPPDADNGILAVETLFARIGIPRALTELGVAENQLDQMAEQSLLAARLVNNNPRRLDLVGARAILAAAFSGDARQLN
jgi:alcohol dehydrogenase